MSWQGINGHDDVVRRFQRALERGRLAGSFLFVGPSGIGKRLFALALAKALLCKGSKDNGGNAGLDPCGQCDSCRLFQTAPESGGDSKNRSKDAAKDSASNSDTHSTHPDLYYVCKPPDKSSLPLELLIGDKEHRGQSGFCYNISRTPFLGHRKIGIIDDADFFKAEGANALLKTLEEPPPDSVLILIGTSLAKQLPTIRSRCQIIRFAPLPPQILGPLLMEQGIASTLEQAFSLAKRSGGSLDQAKDFFDDDIEAIRTELNSALNSAHSHNRMNSVALATKLNEFVEAVGKEAPLKRRRLRLVFNLAIDYFRERLKKNDEAAKTTRRLERTLDALEQIDRNANMPFIVDAWCNDL